jgi:hypothetical protein
MSESAPAPNPENPPAILPQNRAVMGTKLTYGHKSYTFLRPICRICQRGDNTPTNWYRTCAHDPYITYREESWMEPQFETQDDGTKIITGRIERVRTIPVPNWVEISSTVRINGGVGTQEARRKGFIRPSELKNELYPNGIAECCEWSDCKVQEGLKDYKYGRFHSELEAKRAALDIEGTVDGKRPEVYDQERMTRQLAQVVG